MKGKYLSIKIIFILSLSLNVAFIIHFLSTQPPAASAQDRLPVPLHLTDQQVKDIQPIRQKIHKENEHIKKQIQQYQSKLLTALQEEPVDRGEVNRCIDEINGYQKKIQHNTVEEILQVQKHMNPHQCQCFLHNIDCAMKDSTQQCGNDCCRPKAGK